MPELKTARQPLPKADGLMPDHVRIPHRILDMAEGSDRNPLPDDVLPYTYKQIQDACRRAVAWRSHVAKSQGAGDALRACITFQSNTDTISRPDAAGWMKIGWIDDPWIGGKLRIFWHPGTNHVQVDRPPQPRSMLIASTASDPGPTITVVATLNVRNDNLVTMHVHPLQSSEPIFIVVVPAPCHLPFWIWAIRTAAGTKRELRMPTTFWTLDAIERRDLLVQHAHMLASQIACGSEENAGVGGA